MADGAWLEAPGERSMESPSIDNILVGSISKIWAFVESWR